VRQAVISFIVVLSVLTIVGMVAARTMPRLIALGERQAAEPSWGDWYVAVDEDSHNWEHDILYTGYGRAIEQARQADILIIGTSRTELGLDPDTLAQFCAQHGIRIYNMALGYAESSVLPLEIIRRHDLRPKLLLVGYDAGKDLPFFTDATSPLAQKLLRDGAWAELKYTYGSLWTKELQRVIWPLFPYYLGHQAPVIYRSWSTGAFSRATFGWEPKGGQVILTEPDDKTPELRALETDRAARLVTEMQARGSTVIFAWIPAPRADPARARELAQQLGVPAIVPTLDRMSSFDGSHLDRDSARRYTAAMLDGLATLLAQAGWAGTPGAGCTPGPTPPTAPDLQIVRDDASRVWAIPADGHRYLFPDWLTYAVYTGNANPETLEHIDTPTLLRTEWRRMVPSVSPDAPPTAMPAGLVSDATNQAVVLPSGARNLAEKRPAKQSDGGGTAALAVDGNTSGVGADQSIATMGDQKPEHWWQVDLGASLPIDYVQIWSRTDPCCLDRLNNLSIFVSDDDFVSDDPYVVGRTNGVSSYFVLGRVGRPTSVTINRTGRFVRLQMAHPGSTDIAEVQVWSTGAR
jgi:hypothetical protein